VRKLCRTQSLSVSKKDQVRTKSTWRHYLPLALRRFIEIVKVTVKDMVPFSCGIASPRPIGRSLLLGLIGLKFCGLERLV
jgi:hypothetical protein